MVRGPSHWHEACSVVDYFQSPSSVNGYRDPTPREILHPIGHRHLPGEHHSGMQRHNAYIDLSRSKMCCTSFTAINSQLSVVSSMTCFHLAYQHPEASWTEHPTRTPSTFVIAQCRISIICSVGCIQFCSYSCCKSDCSP